MLAQTAAESRPGAGKPCAGGVYGQIVPTRHRGTGSGWKRVSHRGPRFPVTHDQPRPTCRDACTRARVISYPLSCLKSQASSGLAVARPHACIEPGGDIV